MKTVYYEVEEEQEPNVWEPFAYGNEGAIKHPSAISAIGEQKWAEQVWPSVRYRVVMVERRTIQQ